MDEKLTAIATYSCSRRLVFTQ